MLTCTRNLAILNRCARHSGNTRLPNDGPEATIPRADLRRLGVRIYDVSFVVANANPEPS